MIAGSFYFLLLIFGVNHKTVAAWTIVIVVFYVGLAGTGLSVQRAGYGAVLVLLGILMGRPGNLLNILCFAAFCMLLWNPRSLWNIGFQLSFLSVFSLILITPLTARLNFRFLPLGSSLSVLLGTFPVVLYYFNIFSPVSLVANILAIPIFDAVLFVELLSLVFCGIPILNTILIKLTSLFLLAGLAWIKYLSVWRWGYWFLVKPSLLQLLLYYVGLGSILMIRKVEISGRRWFLAGAVIFWFMMMLSFFRHAGSEVFGLTVLESGRNPIAHVQFSDGSHWLINTGSTFPSDQGEWLVAPYLRSLGVNYLEGILLLDLSKKNMGGLRAVLRDFSVRRLIYPQQCPLSSHGSFSALCPLRAKIRTVGAGDKVPVGKESIQVLAENRSGSAVVFECDSWRILMLSRLDKDLLRELSNRKDASEIHVVILPIAGRSGIPDELDAWLAKIHPLIAVLPKADPEIEKHLLSQRIACLSLKDTGALTIIKNSARLEMKSYLSGEIGFLAYP